ncbi:MAG TPA: glycerol-3-phosphate 1-O-acyltransferase PlsY [Bacillota bacterium]|nr:glycerol-3-phosphate 1-O-acyltransferase PlsY [Bacillota bacterium]
MTFADLYHSGLLYCLREHFSSAWQTVLFVLAFLLVLSAAYLLGSLNFGIIISTKKYGTDVRTLGSGNAGSTNMLRNFGKKAAALTFLGDTLKAVAAVIIGRLLLGETGAYISGLFCILGHLFPCYFRFKGGKGVATAAAMILIIDPVIFAAVIVMFLLVLLITRYVSLSSIMAAFIYPAVMYFRYQLSGTYPPTLSFVCAITIAFLIIIMHRENIKRLFRGREPKLVLRKKNRLTPEEFEKEAKKRYDDEVYVDYDENDKK